MKKIYDRMDGHDFEKYCAKLLRKNGFHHVEVTRGSGDQGIDILAYRRRRKYGIQCKCYSYYLGNKAVQEAYAGMKFYECDVAAVLTNQYFTNSAIALAEKTEVLLWNRAVLNELRKCQKSRFLNLLGILSILLGIWLFCFVYSTEGISFFSSVSGILETVFCALLAVGGLFTFIEKGSSFLSIFATLLLGMNALLGFSLIGSLGGLVLAPLILFFFSFFRSRKLKLRAYAPLLSPKRTDS